ncbi:delta-12-fatty acid desaturase [Phycomyces blakesleeanus]
MKENSKAVKTAKVPLTLEKDLKEWEITEIFIKEIRGLIPAHCFERDTLRSFAYLFHDFFFVGILAYGASWIDTFSFDPLRLVLWSAYWFLQSIASSGLWMICHECGHQAFSSSKLISDGVGLIVHTFLLVPYYSWKFTHARHHNSVGHVTRDKTHTPRLRSALGLPPYDEDTEADGPHSVFESSPLFNSLKLVGFLLVAWPFYALFNNPGDTTKDRWVSHFNPASFIFQRNQYWKVVQSTAAVGVMVGVLIRAGQIWGSLAVVKFYVVPYFLVHAWMVVITYLQHTSPEIPHYDTDVWSFQRGIALTVDRSYGPILDHFFHHIGDTHLVHHLVATMPHYHCIEATEHVKKALGKYYLQDNTPIIKALFENWTKCKFVEDEGSVRFYKN